MTPRPTTPRPAAPPDSDRLAVAGRLLLGPVSVASRAGAWPMWAAWLVMMSGLAMSWMGSWMMAVAMGRNHEWRPPVDAASPLELVLVSLSLVIAFTIGPTLSALFAGLCWAAWGAGDESVGRSIASAAKKLMALTPHGGLVVLAMEAGFHWIEASPFIWTRDGLEVAMYNAVAFAGVVYLLATITRTLAPGRASPRCPLPPTCESCGYALAGLPTGATCPECGLALSESLGEHVRPGLWTDARWWDGPALFFRPKRAGRRVRVHDRGAWPAGAFAWSAATTIAASVAVAVAFAAGVRLWEGRSIRYLDEVAGIALLIATWSWLGFFVFAALTASLSGWAAGRGIKRNLMPAAIQLAARMSGVLPWAVVGYAIWVGLLLLIAVEVIDIEALDEPLSTRVVIAGLLLMYVPGLAAPLVWTVQLGRAVRAARWANL